jgi:C-terminal processing protease CtpA/Prc
VLSYVDDEHLGIIVGSRTAGTSGDVQAITTPANYQVRFSGLRVTKHDGHTPIHLVGTAPDVWAVQTIAGFRAGRDEVIERALQVVGAR